MLVVLLEYKMEHELLREVTHLLLISHQQQVVEMVVVDKVEVKVVVLVEAVVSTLEILMELLVMVYQDKEILAEMVAIIITLVCQAVVAVEKAVMVATAVTIQVVVAVLVLLQEMQTTIAPKELVAVEDQRIKVILAGIIQLVEVVDLGVVELVECLASLELQTLVVEAEVVVTTCLKV